MDPSSLFTMPTVVYSLSTCLGKLRATCVPEGPPDVSGTFSWTVVCAEFSRGNEKVRHFDDQCRNGHVKRTSKFGPSTFDILSKQFQPQKINLRSFLGLETGLRRVPRRVWGWARSGRRRAPAHGLGSLFSFTCPVRVPALHTVQRLSLIHI